MLPLCFNWAANCGNIKVRSMLVANEVQRQRKRQVQLVLEGI